MFFQHPRSIRSTLFWPYTLLMVAAFTLLLAYFAQLELEKIEKSTLAAIQSGVNAISENADADINNLDTVAQNIIYSNLIKERFATYVERQPYQGADQEQEEYTQLQNVQILQDLLIAMLGPNRPVDQIYLYPLEGGQFGTGLDPTQTELNVWQQPWYEQAMEKEGGKVIYSGEDEKIGRYFSYPEGRQFLSLIRVFYSNANVPQGIVEVKKSFRGIYDAINNFQTTYESSLYLYGPDGRLLYPFEEEQERDYLALAESAISEEYLSEDGVYILHKTSESSGITAVAAVSKAKLMEPVYLYIKTTLLIMLVVVLLTVLISYIISQVISKPLKAIDTEVRQFEIMSYGERQDDLAEIKTGVTEINNLYAALRTMQLRAKASMDRELQLQQRELQSKILALQAQMNPHFLYNSLATIQAMADEGMDAEIQEMCQEIARMLRYISADSEQLVSIATELDHTWDFYRCMKLRFGENLEMYVEVAPEMEQLQIPKLCLQLLVENAIKFTSKRVQPPWRIEITGNRNGDWWELHIADNGCGFEAEDLQSLNERIRQINESGLLPGLELNGMGILNVFIRFKLLYGENYIFKLCNRTGGGAMVTIGGKMDGT